MKLRTLILSGLIAGASTWVTAQDIDVEVTNLTHGIYFTPILVSAHDADTSLFEVGQAASFELQAMAEGGDLDGLIANLDSIGAVSVANPAEGLLAPATSVAALDIDTGSLGNLSIVTMMLPTNDGFVGLDGWSIPETAGSYTIWLNAYDAGTEANDEQVTGGGAPGAAGIPANPGGNGGSGGTGVTTTEENATVHVHRGNVGDTDATGGISDVDSRIHRWLNPVAKVVVTVK
jgi:hypothetical protein